jgi:hypothetical protein
MDYATGPDGQPVLLSTLKAFGDADATGQPQWKAFQTIEQKEERSRRSYKKRRFTEDLSEEGKFLSEEDKDGDIRMAEPIASSVIVPPSPAPAPPVRTIILKSHPILAVPPSVSSRKGTDVRDLPLSAFLTFITAEIERTKAEPALYAEFRKMSTWNDLGSLVRAFQKSHDK